MVLKEMEVEMVTINGATKKASRRQNTSQKTIRELRSRSNCSWSRLWQLLKLLLRGSASRNKLHKLQLYSQKRAINSYRIAVAI